MRTLVGREVAAAHLGLSSRCVYALTRAGKLPAIRVGRVFKFELVALDRWLAQSSTRQEEAEPAPLTEYAPTVADGSRSVTEMELLGAILAEQRETRRTLVRLANRIAAARKR